MIQRERICCPFLTVITPKTSSTSIKTRTTIHHRDIGPQIMEASTMANQNDKKVKSQGHTKIQISLIVDISFIKVE